MTTDLSAVLPYGPLERIEVYFEHDGPKFFALRSTSLDVRLLALCIDEDDDAETLTWLYLVLSPQRFRRVRSGDLSLLHAFSAAAKSEIWRVVEDYSGGDPVVVAAPVSFADLSPSDLPEPGARLNIPTLTAVPLNTEELRAEASASQRTYAVLELDATGQNRTEFPIGNLGAIGTLFQESVNALAQEELGTPTTQGRVPAQIAADTKMNVVGLRAASFAVILATDNERVLVDNANLVNATLSRLIDLIDAGHQPDIAIGALRNYGRRARAKVVDLLRAVSAADSGLGVILSPRNGDLLQARLSAREVRALVDAVSIVEPTEVDINIERGHLIGSNTRTKTFELDSLVSPIGRFTGRVSDSAVPQIDGLRVGTSSLVRAQIQETQEFSPTESETGRKHTLLNIEELAD